MWCDKSVHVKCHRDALGCVKCCEENIVGYNVHCVDLNEDYGLKSDRVSFNPYSRDSIINDLGDRIDELDHGSTYWNDLSDQLQRCEYKQPLHVKPATFNELKILSLNVRSLHNGIDKFREEIETYSNFDVLSFNETNCTFKKLPNGVTDIILENFHEPILQDPIRKTGRGGGLALYIDKKVCDQEQIESFRPKFEGDGSKRYLPSSAHIFLLHTFSDTSKKFGHFQHFKKIWTFSTLQKNLGISRTCKIFEDFRHNFSL